MLLEAGQIKIRHQFDDLLLNRLRRHVQGAVYYPDPVRGYFLIPLTRENALKVLKFGVENDYTFSHELLLQLDRLAKSSSPSSAPLPCGDTHQTSGCST